jgi:leucyl aminopeptidase (aminopeptidase T)
MAPGATVLVETCAGVAKGERVVVVSDQERLPIAEALQTAATEAGAEVEIVSSPRRTIDNEEPTVAVSEAMARADVVFLVVYHSLAHPARHRRWRAGRFDERLQRAADARGGALHRFHGAQAGL